MSLYSIPIKKSGQISVEKKGNSPSVSLIWLDTNSIQDFLAVKAITATTQVPTRKGVLLASPSRNMSLVYLCTHLQKSTQNKNPQEI